MQVHVHALTFTRLISTSSWTISVPILFSLQLRQFEATSNGNLVDTKAFSSFSFRSSNSLISCAFSSSLFPSSSFQKLISRSRCDSLCSLLRCVLAVVASVSLRSRSHSALSRSDAARSCSALEQLRWLEACHSLGKYFGGDWTSLAIAGSASDGCLEMFGSRSRLE